MADQNIDPSTVVSYVQKYIKKSGVNPEVYAQLGQLAEQVLQDKKIYPTLVNEMINSGIARPDQFDDRVDYQTIITMIAMGRVSQQMMQGV